jgi:hypothetical protein
VDRISTASFAKKPSATTDQYSTALYAVDRDWADIVKPMVYLWYPPYKISNPW